MTTAPHHTAPVLGEDDERADPAGPAAAEIGPAQKGVLAAEPRLRDEQQRLGAAVVFAMMCVVCVWCVRWVRWVRWV